MSCRALAILCLTAVLLVPLQGKAERPAALADTAVVHLDKPQIVAEVLKQSAEQPLHFIMAAGPIWLSRWLTAVPWYGWAIVPALAWREWRQWPSNRWWDPPLDAAFMVLGLIATAWPARSRLSKSWGERRARIVAWSTGARA